MAPSLSKVRVHRRKLRRSAKLLLKGQKLTLKAIDLLTQQICLFTIHSNLLKDSTRKLQALITEGMYLVDLMDPDEIFFLTTNGVDILWIKNQISAIVDEAKIINKINLMTLSQKITDNLTDQLKLIRELLGHLNYGIEKLLDKMTINGEGSATLSASVSTIVQKRTELYKEGEKQIDEFHGKMWRQREIQEKIVKLQTELEIYCSQAKHIREHQSLFSFVRAPFPTF